MAPCRAARPGSARATCSASDKPPGPELAFTLAALEVYDELEARLGEAARIRRKGALIVHPDAATWAAEPGRLAAAGVPGARLVDPGELRELEPELTGPACGASLFPGDLQCDPRAIAQALAREAAAAGATVRTSCAVAAVDGGGVRLATGERVAARRDRHRRRPVERAAAAGAGLPLPLEPRKGQLVRLAAPAPDLVRHKVVDGSYLASVASADAGLQLSTVVETTCDGDVLVGSSRERRGFDTSVDPALSTALVRRAAALFPRLGRLPLRDAWAGLRPWLPDGLPAIGPSRRVPGLWLATGHEGAGVALGPVTGRLVAQLYTGEPPVVDPAPFDPDRFARVAAVVALARRPRPPRRLPERAAAPAAPQRDLDRRRRRSTRGPGS